jgi:adenylate cyclase
VIDRRAGEGRYAHLEREQRWLLQAAPTELTAPVSIADRYLRGTRLRLRRIENDGAVVYKLGQKVRTESDQPERNKLTTMYLSVEEYSILGRLDGHDIGKTRWRWAGPGHTLAVDVFHGALTGLILAECELSDLEPRRTPPPGAVVEVTDDDRFAGGTLARTTAEDIGRLLTGFGIVPNREGG